MHGSSSITITGDTEGLLVPGSTLPIDLSLDNTNDFDYTVQQPHRERERRPRSAVDHQPSVQPR